MPEQPMPDPSGDRPVQARLQELAAFLREADHLSPGVGQTLADLVAELTRDLDPEKLSPAEKTYLADTIAQLTGALRQRHGPGPIQAARARLQQALAQAEASAPVVTGVLERLLDVLATLGI